MRIDLAYCIELGKVIDIYEAHTAFFAQKERGRFHFFCSDERCRKAGVIVSGVNYDKLADETPFKRRQHFRKVHEHDAECDWMVLEEALQKNEPLIELDPEDETERNIRRVLQEKESHLITCFSIPPAEGESRDSPKLRELNEIRRIQDPTERKKRLVNYANRGAGAQADSLEELVSCFLDLRKEKLLDNAELRIIGVGSMSYRNAFSRITRENNSSFCVHYGGARLYKRYGKKGFSMTFLDEIDGKPVSFYVSKELLEASPRQSHFLNMLQEHEQNREQYPYISIYWIGGIEKKAKTVNATFKSLAHVVFRHRPETESLQR